MAIVKPNEMDFSAKNIIMIISGLPGVGKTTLALSAPDVVLIDADEGIVRVRPEHRKDSSIVKTYEELLNDVKQFAGRYKTVVIDTGGALIELMKDWAMRTDAKANRKGGGISQTGYGIVKAEFLRLSAELRRNFNVVFLFHTAKEKNGDEVFYDIVCEGSARTIVWQPADLGAYLQIIGEDRVLCFSPTANYNAKSAYGITDNYKLPRLEAGTPNNFLTNLFDQVRANLAAETEAAEGARREYNSVMQAGIEAIETITDAESAKNASATIDSLDHKLTSKAELRRKFAAKLKAVGLKWDKASESFVPSEG